ncbi:MAG TPA: hypothetical protein VNE16_02600 [Vicinamibacterales bacterium]|nr:hypothetical protein [Vicinamibacterales bacterium]
MRLRTWSVVAVASAALLLLLVVSLSDTRRKAQHIYSQLDALNVRHRYVEAKLRRLRSDVNLSGIFIRDYLLDHHTRRAPQYRAELQDLRQSTTATIGTLTPLVGEPERRRLQSLRTRLDDYWQTFDPLFD